MSDFDLIIIGAGPAGLTAAQYGARAALKVLVIEQLSIGGQALVIDALENYPGNITQKSGFEFAMDLHNQAETFGAAFTTGEVVSLAKENNSFAVKLADGSVKNALAVILAAGSKPRMLGVPGESEFSGKGVSYCATCDGPFFRNKKIFVVGGGDAACDEARFLSKLTTKVVLIHRRDAFRAQKSLVQRTLENPNIEVRYNTTIKEIKGEAKVKSVLLIDTLTGAEYEEEADAVFIFAGTVAQSKLAAQLNADLDESGCIITDHKMATNIKGFYAAGDIRSGTFRQVVTAAGDGATAAHNAAGYIDELK